MIENLESEQNVIGGLMLFPGECQCALSELSENDFYDETLSQIFKIYREAAKDSKDPAQNVMKSDDEQIRKTAIFCAQTFISTANYQGYVDIVRKNSQRRRINGQIQELAFADPEPEYAISEMEKLIEREKPQTGKHENEQAKFLIDYQSDIYKPFDPSTRILTGFPRIDRTTGGLLKGSLSYIGAPPSTGKTSFAVNIAGKQIKDGGKVDFFSLEMSRAQIMDRLLSSRLRIPYDSIQRKQLKQEQQNAMSQEIGRMYGSKTLNLYDNVLSVEDIAAKVYETKPDLAIVDYIQCVRSAQNFRDGRQAINYISAELKRIARQNNCHMMVLSQVARTWTTDKGSGKKTPSAPRMSDLKESGNLEADGDYIIMLFRPYVYNKTDDCKPEFSRALIDKNKYGETGIIDLCFRGVVQTFEEAERD